MNKPIKILLSAGIALCALGGAVCGIGAVTGGSSYAHEAFGRSGNSFHNYTDVNTYKQDKTSIEEFTAIKADLKHADLIIKPSDDSNYYLEYETISISEDPITADIKNGILNLTEYSAAENIYTRGIERFFGIGFGRRSAEEYKNYVTLYIPKDNNFSECSVHTEYGDINIKDLNTDFLDLDTAYGDFELTETSIKAAEISETYGDLDINNSFLQSANISVTYGDVYCKNINLSKDVQIETQYGDISIIPDPVCKDGISIDAQTDFGSIHGNRTVSENKFGESCIQTAENEISSLTIKAVYGDITIN